MTGQPIFVTRHEGSGQMKQKRSWQRRWRLFNGPTGDFDMSINIPRGKSDEVLDQIREALHDYETDHPAAEIDLYRQNSVSVRVRIVDPGFAGQNKPQRSQQVWRYLGKLSEEVQSDI